MLLEDQIFRIAKGHKQGFTFDLIWMRVLSKVTGDVGFAVAYIDTQEKHGKEGLRDCIAHAKGEKGSWTIGGWYDKDSNAQNDFDKYYFDSVRVYTTRIAAIEAALRSEQIGIYDLSHGYLDISTRDLSLRELINRKKQVDNHYLVNKVLTETKTKSYNPSLKALQLESDLTSHPQFQVRSHTI